MIRTEERLTAALRETARSVREDSLSPLVVPAGRRSRWARLLAPIAAAAAVTLIAVLALVLPGGPNKPVGGPPPEAPPRYYVVMQARGAPILVLSTSTGSVAGRVPSPGSKWIPAAITASGGGQFVAEYFYAPKIVSPRQKQSPRQTQTRLYSFRLDASGHPTGLSLMHGGVLAGFAPGQTTISGGALAVSPDGSQVALVVTPAPPCYRGCPTEIAVINLRTGQRELWSGGLDRPGMTLSISGLSWAAGSGPLVFLAQWCRLQTCAFFPHQTHIAQVRTLNLDTRGGPLTQGSVLLGQSARYPDIVAARLVPGRTALAVAVLSSPALSAEGYLWLNAQVIDVPLGGGGRSSVLYHGRMNISASRDVDLSPDASGRHWLLLLGYSNNWISDPDGGRLHRLPIPRRAGYSIISQAGFEAWW